MIELGMNVTDGNVYGIVEELNKDAYGNEFAVVGWGKELGLYNNETVNVRHLKELNW